MSSLKSAPFLDGPFANEISFCTIKNGKSEMTAQNALAFASVGESAND